MNRAIPQTLTDYVLIAINPTLIGLLVGSLMFFLVEVFYQGDYTVRLQFISAMYVLGVVCIARISIEEGRGYASMYALPLAIVVAIAMAKFVSFSGPFAAFSTPISWGLIALGWWSADKLIWDCTVIADAPDTSGQGLLQAVGLDGSGPPQPVRAAPETVDESLAASIASAPEPLRKITKWLERRRRAPHTPGVWVIYYSLAALPLFGLGQWFIPAENQASRSFAFGCLVIYVACGLSLLLTTSFLGLRRYLGQKGIYVPLDITATWLMVGGVMIVALLIAAAILPRPDAGGGAKPIAFSPIRSPSSMGVGNDGPQDRSGQRTGPQAKTGDLQSGKPAKSKDQPGGSSGKDGQSGSNPQSGGKQPDGKSANQQSGNQQSSSQQPSSNSSPSKSQQSNSPQNNSPNQNPNQNQNASAQNKSPDSSKQGGDTKSGDATKNNPQQPRDPQQPNGKNPPQNNPSGQGSSSSSPPPPSANSSPPSAPYQQNQPPPMPNHNAPPPSAASSPLNVAAGIGTFLKWVLYAVIACVAAYFAWKYREQIAAAWQQFLDELRAWWARLFGQKSAATAAATEAAAPSAPPPRPFADFADPFATGQAARWKPAEVVTYSFAALEAWARERGCPRAADQTPTEFAQLVAGREPAVTLDVRSLADLYCQIAYAHAQPTAASLEPVRRLWQQLRAEVAVA